MKKSMSLLRDDTEGSIYAAWCPMFGKFDIRELNKHCDELARLSQLRKRTNLIEDHDLDALVYAGTKFGL